MNANLEKKCPIRFRNTLFTRMVFKQLEILVFMLAGNGSGILQKGGVLSEIVKKNAPSLNNHENNEIRVSVSFKFCIRSS